MIIECYHCTRCAFEDITASDRVAANIVTERQDRVEFVNCLLVFACVEEFDGPEETRDAAREVVELKEQLGASRIVLCPNGHLSPSPGEPAIARTILNELHAAARAHGDDAVLLSFGYHKAFEIHCKGHPGSVAGRRFFGTDEKRLQRLLHRLGLCPGPEAAAPAWLLGLLDKRLQLLGSRTQTYHAASSIVRRQLDSGAPELWTCMLLEGEDQPIDTYILQLYRALSSKYDITIHRAFNVTVPSLANAAEYAIRTYGRAVAEGKLRIYVSHVDNLELLLSPDEVLLAFPKPNRRPGSPTGAIAFGLYCRAKAFAQKMAHWYHHALVDSRYGRIRTLHELHMAMAEATQEPVS